MLRIVAGGQNEQVPIGVELEVLAAGEPGDVAQAEDDRGSSPSDPRLSIQLGQFSPRSRRAIKWQTIRLACVDLIKIHGNMLRDSYFAPNEQAI